MPTTLDQQITQQWKLLEIPDQVVDAYGPEELEMQAYLTGKNFLEVSFDCPPLMSESIFILLTTYAQLYYLGGLMLHIFSLHKSQDDFLLSYPFVTLETVLRIPRQYYAGLAEELLLRDTHMSCVRSFIRTVFIPRSHIPDVAEDARAILAIWDNNESLRQQLYLVSKSPDAL